MKMNNKTESHLTGMWVNFFTAAGIPSDVSATYALTFIENRIQNDMLLDLNKEYLRDMGITRMGDVIAILRHAKQVHESTARDKVLSTAVAVAVAVAGCKVPVAAVTGRSTLTHSPSSPATRMLEHYTRNPQAQEAPKAASLVLKRKPSESGSTMDMINKKARMIRFSSPTKATIKDGPSNTVFSRLGNNEVTKTVSTKPVGKAVFSRLGAKSDSSTEEQIPLDEHALQYEGILKSPPQGKKTVTITTTRNTRKISCTMRADEQPLSVKDKLALPKAKSVKFSNHVQYKEIEPIKKAAVTVSSGNKAKAASFFNKPERRLSLPAGGAGAAPPAPGVKARLGSVNNLTITSTVFHRLGV